MTPNSQHLVSMFQGSALSNTFVRASSVHVAGCSWTLGAGTSYSWSATSLHYGVATADSCAFSFFHCHGCTCATQPPNNALYPATMSFQTDIQSSSSWRAEVLGAPGSLQGMVDCRIRQDLAHSALTKHMHAVQLLIAIRSGQVHARYAVVGSSQVF
jgi:hypothetical protein